MQLLKRIVCFFIMIVITGCGAKSVVTDSETYAGEYFLNFSDVPSIAAYLDMDWVDITTLYEDENRLVFSFPRNFDYGDDTEVTDREYAEMLEAEGYAYEVLDATISSQINLEDDAYTISIIHFGSREESETTINFHDEFIELRKGDIPNIDRIADKDNNIFDISKK
ncbi:MAG: hypothetical protein LBU77_01080 [Clostridiales bacterium]|nr:hypothetical protein [Clostridiales bacterium]